MQSRLDEIDKDLALSGHDFELGHLQTKSIIENMDTLQSEISEVEKKALVESAISKIVLTLKDKRNFKRTFALKIIPTTAYADRIGVLELEFDVDTSKGKSDWKINAPFELTSENYGKNSPVAYRKQKRHWLHKVANWQKEVQQGKTLNEIAEKEGLSKSMVSRKMSLLQNLHWKIIEKIFSVKYADQSETLTFRRLDKLSKLPKARQLERFSLGKF